MTTQQAAESGHIVTELPRVCPACCALLIEQGKALPGGLCQSCRFTGPTHTLRAEGHDASEDGTGRRTPIIPIDMRQASRGETMTNNRREGTSGGAPGTGIGNPGDPSPTVSVSHPPAIAYRTSGNCGVMEQGDRTAALNTATDPSQNIVQRGMAVRRLTPRECERLQGFPDDWTKWRPSNHAISDSARYRMLGNAVAVPVAEWIARRLAQEVLPFAS